MHKVLSIGIVSAILLLGSCKVSDQKLAGTYRLKTPSKTKLVLHADKRFEFVKNFSEPGPPFFADTLERNFNTSGTWSIDADRNLWLTSAPTLQAATVRKDSIIRNTGITSLSFYDSDGDPVAIRFIKFLPDKIKFYRGNSISFFREDFVQKDTLEFHFYGYAPVKWPEATSMPLKENQTHLFYLQPEYRDGFFKQYSMRVEKKKLLSTDKSFALYRE